MIRERVGACDASVTCGPRVRLASGWRDRSDPGAGRWEECKRSALEVVQWVDCWAPSITCARGMLWLMLHLSFSSLPPSLSILYKLPIGGEMVNYLWNGGRSCFFLKLGIVCFLRQCSVLGLNAATWESLSRLMLPPKFTGEHPQVVTGCACYSPVKSLPGRVGSCHHPVCVTLEGG